MYSVVMMAALSTTTAAPDFWFNNCSGGRGCGGGLIGRLHKGGNCGGGLFRGRIKCSSGGLFQRNGCGGGLFQRNGCGGGLFHRGGGLFHRNGCGGGKLLGRKSCGGVLSKAKGLFQRRSCGGGLLSKAKGLFHRRGCGGGHSHAYGCNCNFGVGCHGYGGWVDEGCAGPAAPVDGGFVAGCAVAAPVINHAPVGGPAFGDHGCAGYYPDDEGACFGGNGCAGSRWGWTAPVICCGGANGAAGAPAGVGCVGAPIHGAPIHGAPIQEAPIQGAPLDNGILPSNLPSYLPDNIAPAAQEEKKSATQTVSKSNQARLLVTLPTNAVFYMDGQKMKSTGSFRTFRTPELENGQGYYYELKVELQRGKRIYQQSKRIIIRAGDEIKLKFENIESGEVIAMTQ